MFPCVCALARVRQGRFPGVCQVCVTKKARVAILISDKIDFKTKVTLRDKEEHYIMIKGSVQQANIFLVNMYALNIVHPNK